MCQEPNFENRPVFAKDMDRSIHPLSDSVHHAENKNPALQQAIK